MHRSEYSLSKLILPLLVFAYALSACTTVPPEKRADSDPWEPLNRSLYKVNDALRQRNA